LEMEVLRAIEAFKETQPQFRHKHDVLAFALHCLAINFGFRFISLDLSRVVPGTETQTKETKEVEPWRDIFVPEGWNSQKDAFAFYYKHTQSSFNFVIKSLILGDSLLVYSSPIEAGKVFFVDLKVNDYVMDSEKGLTDYENLLKLEKIQNLEDTFKSQILLNLLPGLKPEKEAATTTTTTTTTTNLQGPQLQPQPRPRIPDPDFHFDRSPFPLIPPGGGGFPIADGRGNLIGPFADGRGNLIGPNHPGFGYPFSPLHPDPSVGLPQPLPRGAIPPGARFDPFAPPQFPQDPDPDAESPYGHMFL